ncbi:MAG: DNA polymerase III subunit delta [Flavobacteriaceae bacterium]|nr:DNA polymerase III subunit delta [Flavobacteriaceae bacterium]MCY4266394.1 DNA polymerase III subunit delta [Flavobacteriaceae bacterium]MCY4298473.1 DNA polymerase III subunit delta [Flavobacteriaceae bacterium]
MIHSNRLQKYNQVKQDITHQKFAPIYLFSGMETYFIKELTHMLEQQVLHLNGSDFDLIRYDGNQASPDEIVASAKMYPMFGKYRLVIVQRAQNIRKNIDILTQYAENPSHSTILIYSYEGKEFDKRTKTYKVMAKSGVVLEFKPLYDSEVESWMSQRAKSMNLNVDLRLIKLIREYNGNSLDKIQSVLDKLTLVVGQKPVTSEIIDNYIGISKDFNFFELQQAIGKRDAKNSFLIAKHLSNNPSMNPIVATLSILHGYFSKILTLHCLADKSKAAKELKIHPHFVNEYLYSAKLYDFNQTKAVLNEIFNTDLRIKGIKANRSKDHFELNELISRILNC